MKKTLLLIALLAPASLVFGADAKAGAAAYAKSCTGCHGPAGGGNPAMAKVFPTMPDLTSAKVQAESDAELMKAISEGKGKMPAQKTAPAADVVAFLRTLKK